MLDVRHRGRRRGRREWRLGDGYADVIVGADNGDRAFVYLGGPSGAVTTSYTMLAGPAGTGFGGTVAYTPRRARTARGG